MFRLVRLFVFVKRKPTLERLQPKSYVLSSLEYSEAGGPTHYWRLPRGLRRAGLTIRGGHTNIRRGHFLVRVARIFSGGALFPQKS